MEPETILLYVVLGFVTIFVLTIIVRSVRLVRQSQVIVIERLGRYSRTLGAGLHLLIPFIDNVRAAVDRREQVLDYPPQSVITKDNVVTMIDTVIYYYITDPVKAIYEIRNLDEAILKLSVTTIRNIIGDILLDELLTSRESVNSKLRVIVDEATDPWGVKVNRIELKAIEPPREILDAMSKQMKAERDKRAVILEAEGIRQSQILKAEGEKQAKILESEGSRQSQILRAEGEAQAWSEVYKAKADALKYYFEAIHSGNADQKVIAIKYLEALEHISNGTANKVFIPYEASGFLSSLGSIKELFTKSE
jgi:regulator of protease activity HflC (stomatin/prohibitin superfamily)